MKNLFDSYSSKITNFLSKITLPLCRLIKIQLNVSGSSTVVVSIEDENDVPPEWTKSEWHFDVPEAQSPDTILATLTVRDPDIKNTFSYKVSTNLVPFCHGHLN